jgi:hypothetical protein
VIRVDLFCVSVLNWVISTDIPLVTAPFVVSQLNSLRRWGVSPVRKSLSRWVFGALAFGLLGSPAAQAQDATPLKMPDPIPPATLGPNLPTHPVRKTAAGFVNEANSKQVFNERWIDASLLPGEQGIWVLDFAFKPVRILNIDIPGKGRRQVHYMYYQVVNHTGKPRMFVPQFSLLPDTGERVEDAAIPKAVELIQTREDPTIKLLGAVNIMGVIPASTKQGIDDAVFGVAIWDNVNPAADKFSVFVRGLSDGYKEEEVEGKKEKVTKYKTIRIDFIRRGDQFQLKEREIQLLDPAFEWIYW